MHAPTLVRDRCIVREPSPAQQAQRFDTASGAVPDSPQFFAPEACLAPNPLPVAAAPAPPFFAADVGGTHVRVGVVSVDEVDGPVRIGGYRQYRCADHAGLGPILADFLAHSPSLERGVIASAGHQLADGSVISANLPWPLSVAAIRQQLGLQDLRLVNDFEAVAHAAAQVESQQVLQLTGPAEAARGPILMVGPGTGLGAALWIPAGHGAIVLPTEAGQSTLAASTELEMAIVGQLQAGRRHVAIEHAISGPGLLNLYNAVCALEGKTPGLQAPDAVSRAGCDGSDPQAVQALEVFCALLGSAIGDMALNYGAHAIYLAGGILPGISDFLARSQFAERFLDKGVMREALQRIPVRVVEHGQLGVIGAARWYLHQLQH